MCRNQLCSFYNGFRKLSEKKTEEEEEELEAFSSWKKKVSGGVASGTRDLHHRAFAYRFHFT